MIRGGRGGRRGDRRHGRGGGRGYLVTSTPSYTTYNYYNTLPCTAATVVAGGVTYYQCGSTWYNQAYSGDSVTYVTVAPPPGY